MGFTVTSRGRRWKLRDRAPVIKLWYLLRFVLTERWRWKSDHSRVIKHYFVSLCCGRERHSIDFRNSREWLPNKIEYFLLFPWTSLPRILFSRTSRILLSRSWFTSTFANIVSKSFAIDQGTAVPIFCYLWALVFFLFLISCRISLTENFWKS